MAAAIPLRSNFSADDLRRLARSSRDANQARRLLALAAIYDGSSRSDAARIGGVGLQIVRDWVVRFNTHGTDGLIDRHGPGASPLLSAAQLRALVEMVKRGPIPAIHGVVRGVGRFGTMDLGRVPHLGQRANYQSAAARTGRSQAVRTATSSCTSIWCN